MIAIWITGCDSGSAGLSQEAATVPTHAAEPAPTDQLTTTPVPSEQGNGGPTEAAEPTRISAFTPAPVVLPDLSAVTLHEATFLMDPRYFQVSMDDWPEDLPEEIVVSVDGEPYTCEELFPDQFPDRVYCYGQSPQKGDEVSVVVTLPGDSDPLLEISFIVPAPGRDGDG